MPSSLVEVAGRRGLANTSFPLVSLTWNNAVSAVLSSCWPSASDLIPGGGEARAAVARALCWVTGQTT
jgi:hypothetical protein